jgi:DNA-binding NarL/FixJ family response regulator
VHPERIELAMQLLAQPPRAELEPITLSVLMAQALADARDCIWPCSSLAGTSTLGILRHLRKRGLVLVSATSRSGEAHRETRDQQTSDCSSTRRKNRHRSMIPDRQPLTLQQPRIKVLIAHSDPFIAAGLVTLLRERRDFEVVVSSRALTSNARSKRLPSVHVVVADYDSGMRLLASTGARRSRVIILTHSDSEVMICRALERGVRGYLLLGCSLQELIKSLRTVNAGNMALGPLAVSRVADRMKQPALTHREEDILRQLMLGLSNKGIARKLTVALGTVKTHVKAILRKLDVTSRTGAVVIAQRRGILREERVNVRISRSQR